MMDSSEEYVRSEWGDLMGKVSFYRKMESFFRIWKSIYDNPTVALYRLAQDTGFSRGTVTKYLAYMVQHQILTGPFLTLNSSSNYREYVCLAEVDDPVAVYEGLRTFPGVVYHALSFGEWNTFVITKGIDLSRLKGFKKTILQEMRHKTVTQEVELLGWNNALKKMREKIGNYHFENEQKEDEKNHVFGPSLPWGKEEWMLFRDFHRNLRKPKTPSLKRNGIQYETYRKWMETLEKYCTVNTCFYPLGYENYTHHCFLFSSDCEQELISLFSFLPVSSTFFELEKDLLVITHTPSPPIQQELLTLVLEMGKRNIVRSYQHGVALSELWHDPEV